MAEAMGRWEEGRWGSSWLREELRKGVRVPLGELGVAEVSRRGRRKPPREQVCRRSGRRRKPADAQGAAPRSGAREEPCDAAEAAWVEEMLAEGRIEELEGPPPSKVGQVFPLRQRRKVRWITNLKQAGNTFTKVPRFRNVRLEEIAAVIKEGDWGVTLDIRTAFAHVLIRKEDRWLLAFWAAGRLFVPRVLPFGWNASPYYWDRVAKVLKARMLDKGLRGVVYVDDILLLGQTQEEVEKAKEVMLEILREMGLVVAADKTSDVSQEVVYLGYTLNLRERVWEVRAEDRHTIRRAAARIMNAKFVSKRQVARLIGKIQGRRMALPQLNLRTGTLYRWLRRLDELPWGKSVTVPGYVKSELRYWASLKRHQARAKFIEDRAEWLVESDASHRGWGVVVFNLITGERWGWSDYWPTGYQAYHITALETVAAERGLDGLIEMGVRSTCVRWRTDNMATLAALSKFRSSSAVLDRVARRLARRLLGSEIRLAPVHWPGVLNTRADYRSRDGLQELGDFRVRRDIFSTINRARPHQIDAFATRASRMVRDYFSPYPDPSARGWDAMCERWVDTLWMHPPWAMIRKVLARLEAQALARVSANVTLFIPRWFTATWWPMLWRLAEEVWELEPTPLLVHPVTKRLMPKARWSQLVAFFGSMPSGWPRRRARAIAELSRRLKQRPSVWVRDQGEWTRLTS